MIKYNIITLRAIISNSLVTKFKNGGLFEIKINKAISAITSHHNIN